MRGKAAKQLRRMTPDDHEGNMDKQMYKKLKRIHKSLPWYTRYVG